MQTDSGTAAELLARLFEESADAVFGFALARCGSRQLAAEVTSDVFMEAARVASCERTELLTSHWLFHVARLRLIDRWRAAERHRNRIERTLAMRKVETGTESDVRTDAVGRALDSLPQRQRAALVLRYVDDFSVTEVSEALTVSYQAAESLLARARRGFAEAYSAHLGPTGEEEQEVNR